MKVQTVLYEYLPSILQLCFLTITFWLFSIALPDPFFGPTFSALNTDSFSSAVVVFAEISPR